MANNTIETRRQDKRTAAAEAQRRESPRINLDGAPVRGRPANENDPGTSVMLARLRRSPSYTPYYAAFFLSLTWIAGWFFTFSSVLTGTAGGLPETMRALALLALPIGIGWVVAYFLWRASQLRQVSEVLMQSAMRLIRPQDIAVEGIASIAQAVRSEVDVLVGGVEHAVQRAAVLEEIVHKEIAAIERAFGGNEDRIRTLVAGIENQRTALHQAGLIINNDANPLLTRLESSTQNLDTILGNAHITLSRIEQGMRDTTVNLARSIDEVAARAQAAGEDISGKTSQMERVSGLMSSELHEFSRHLAGQIDRLTQATGTLNSEASEFGRNVQDMEANVVRAVRQGVEQLTGINQDMAHVIERAGTETARQIDSSRALVTQGLHEITIEYLDKVAQSRTDLFSGIDQSAGNLVAELVTTSGTIAAHLKETAEIVNRQMQDSGISLASNIENSGGIVTEKLIAVSDSFVDNVTRTREELTGLLTANTKMMTEQLNSTATEMTNAFAETAVRVTRQVNEANSLIAERLVKTSTEVTSQLDTASTDIIGAIGKASSAFSEGLGQTTLQITGRLEQDTGLLVDRVDRAAKELDSVSVATAVKLDEAHRKFSKHIDTANVYLADQLSTVAGAIDERLEGISMNLTGKLEMTGSRVSERLEDVTGLVERSIDKFNEEMERVLVNRKDALDHLIGDAARRADEVDAVMTGYMKLIEGSLATSEARSKDIGRIVAEQTALAAVNLEQEIGKLEASTGGQITQAARALRDQQERAMAAMNEMLSATATDFQQTAQDMRITAQQVVKDIDVARAEMKQAIIGLPEETRNNADAMRRVVSDQISALNALAEVVKRQTGTLDVSGPGMALHRSYRGSPPGKSEGATVQAPPPGTVRAQQSNIERSETAEQTMVLRGKILADLAHSTAKIAESRITASKAASPEDLPREMTILVDKLNLAARDLVEAIDGGLPRDLEKRFGGGERGVYTSRLYEGRGKRLQKLIAERYGNDRLVRGRVDVSIRLFEQLLDMMSETPQGEAMVEACLASESGRIYAMLAETSGRMPPR
ncbi:MAG: hypothetical protein ACREDX_00630 [Aestuariivirga sp.]